MSDRRLRARTVSGQVWLVPSRDVMASGSAGTNRILAQAPDEQLRELASSVGLPISDAALASREVLLDELARALDAAGFVLVRDTPEPPLLGERDDPSPLLPDIPIPDDPVDRPTYIEIQVIHESGRGYPGLSLDLDTPDGEPRHVLLDGASRGRLDDIPTRGTCRVRLPKPLPDATATVGPQVQLLENDVVAPVSNPPLARLATARSHRVVVVEGKTELVFRDPGGFPIPDEPIEVRVDNRTLTGTTDADGVFVAYHRSSAPACEVTLPKRMGNTWNGPVADG